MNMEMGQFKRAPGSRVPQESAPKQPESHFEQWTSQAKDLIDRIDHSPQLEETEPGVVFAQDLLELLSPKSSSELEGLFDRLYGDITNHDFLTFGDRIVMAHDTSINELGTNFADFSAVLEKLPIPVFNKDLIQKRNNLTQAFSNRANQLLGK
ncbi:MAG TPA: hypothetical protein PKZ56_02365 [Candidatus Paceibacterota bacterium]|nr:hypothetical protein [Candidatus Paceibacterota bacterium]